MSIKRDLFTNDVFIIDMSSLKELYDRYPKNLFPTIWQHVSNLIQNGQLCSHVEVHREIKNTTNPQDPILKWSNKNKSIFASIDNCQINNIPKIKSKYDINYWNNQTNRPSAWADPYLIAMAICENAILITQENKIKINRIPPIANQFNLRSFNLLEFFSHLKIKL